MRAGTFLFAAALSTLASVASAVTVNLGPSSQNFTLYGTGPLASNNTLGTFVIGQGTGSFNAATNVTTYLLSGTIAGGDAGFNSGTYQFITSYAGSNTPAPGANAPVAQSVSVGGNLNNFTYSFLDPSLTMMLNLFGTPTGNYSIPIAANGSFVPTLTGLSFAYVTATCTGVATCTQNQVGLTRGATESGPVTGSVSFAAPAAPAVPEPATWAMMLLGFGAIGFAVRRSRKSPTLAPQTN